MTNYGSNGALVTHDQKSQFPTRGLETASHFGLERVIGYDYEDRAAAVVALGLVSALGFVCQSAVSAVPDKQAL